MILRSLLFAALLGSAASASAGVYKCRDAQGTVTYQAYACASGQVPVDFTKAADTEARSLSVAGQKSKGGRPVSRR